MNFKETLKEIKAFVFDVDGVLSPICIPTAQDGEPLRMVNVRDGYAIRKAVLSHFPIAIITGGRSQGVEIRYRGLGVEDIYMGSSIKKIDFNDFLSKYDLEAKDILYVGDDIPDYEVMKMVGLACCPADAAVEIQAISHYVSDKRGGEGCVRDVVEQVLKAQGYWMENDEAFGW